MNPAFLNGYRCMPNPHNLEILRQLREMNKISQTNMATFFGFAGRSARNRIGEWENGDKIPPVKHRAKFILYLIEKLGLREDLKRFEEVWQVVSNEWNWLPLTEAERQQYFFSQSSIATESSLSEGIARPGLLEEIMAVYPSGTLNHTAMIQSARKLDLLAISHRGFFHLKHDVVYAIKNNNAVIRVLILHPESLFVQEREKQEGIEARGGQIVKECEATITIVTEMINQIIEENHSCAEKGKKRTLGSVELRTFNTMPYCSCMITDKSILYMPYLIHERVGFTPSFELRITGVIAQHIQDHFDYLWKHAQAQVNAIFE